MLESLDDKKIFTYFEEISNIPRGSYHNEKISGYLAAFAKERGLFCRVDDACNVVIKKPACGSSVRKKPVMLQGHMDMVCVSKDGRHDFLNEGLPLRVDGDYIYSEGTTLGGDDGIALAYILAILDSDEYNHPPIEAVFTTDEEVGMDGASALDTSDLEADMLINIDNEEEGVILVSCAGGASVDVEFAGTMTRQSGNRIEVSVSGLAGGHSGTEIDTHPSNASIVLGRMLSAAYETDPFLLVSWQGGDKDNVITGEAKAQISCAGNAEKLVEKLSDLAAQITDELATQEPKLTIRVSEPVNETVSCFDTALTESTLDFLALTPTGVQVYSADVPGMVESSLNMGVAADFDTGMRLGFSVRSQKKSYKEYMIHRLKRLACRTARQGVHHKVQVRGEYPAWDYKKESNLRACMIEEFQNCFGTEPRVEGIHAGLECGIFSQKMPELDIVSIGPEILNIHTVNERMSISSAKRYFDYLINVLEKLGQHV